MSSIRTSESAVRMVRSNFLISEFRVDGTRFLSGWCGYRFVERAGRWEIQVRQVTSSTATATCAIPALSSDRDADISTRTVRCAGELPAFLAVPATDAKAPASCSCTNAMAWCGTPRSRRALRARRVRLHRTGLLPQSIRIRRRFTVATSATT